MRIINFLELYHIKNKREYTFNDCFFKNKLRFDFAILDDYRNVLCLIEFDGKQHFEPKSFGKDKSEKRKQECFEDVKIKDNIKTKYCKEKNIKLIRIPYWEIDNIETILKTELSDIVNFL
jgi:hypothetical protein